MRWAFANTYADAHANPDSNSNSHAYSYSYANAHTNTNSQAHSNTHTHTNPDSNSNSHTNPDAHANPDSNAWSPWEADSDTLEASRWILNLFLRHARPPHASEDRYNSRHRSAFAKCGCRCFTDSWGHIRSQARSPSHR